MHGSLSDDIICSKMRTVFPRAKSEENYELREQVMSKDKYTDIFSRQIEAIAFITLKYFVTRVKNVCEQLIVCCVGRFHLSFLVRLCGLTNISLLGYHPVLAGG